MEIVSMIAKGIAVVAGVGFISVIVVISVAGGVGALLQHLMQEIGLAEHAAACNEGRRGQRA